MNHLVEPMWQTYATPDPGLYRHYKGHLYLPLGVAHDANYEDRAVVVYVPLQLDGAHEGPRLAVRTLGKTERYPDDDAWWDRIALPAPTATIWAPNNQPRFDRVAEHFTADLL